MDACTICWGRNEDVSSITCHASPIPHLLTTIPRGRDKAHVNQNCSTAEKKEGKREKKVDFVFLLALFSTEGM